MCIGKDRDGINSPEVHPGVQCRSGTVVLDAGRSQFVAFCRDNNIRNSVGRTGIRFGATAESFWATLKKELVHLHPFDTLVHVHTEVFEYVEIYYNR
ncbi:IS3 family transposase [Frankia sp. Mgl5]|uniref:IS3 family transposase n=1 Tax=Frankia sp. Mgl5 TaxID=2933793 RepID=UPI0020350EAE|nr:IS3 family transposase [Frankia sp. Mgl5]